MMDDLSPLCYGLATMVETGQCDRLVGVRFLDCHMVSQNKNKVSEISHFHGLKFGNRITLFPLRKYLSLLFSFVFIGAFVKQKSHFIFENSQERLWVCLSSRRSLAVPFLFF